MKKFVPVEFEIIEFSDKDVITTSGIELPDDVFNLSED